MNYNTEKEKKLSIILILSIILLLIFFSYFLSLLFSNNIATVDINIENLSSVLPNISKEDEKLLISQLYDNISSNTPLSTSIPSKNISIDIDSVEKDTYNSYTSLSFIINVEDLSQQYLVHYYDGDNFPDYKITVECFSSCLSLLQDDLSSNLPFSKTSSAGIEWTLDKNKYFSPNNVDLIVYISSCEQNLDTKEITNDIYQYISKYNTERYTLEKNISCFIQP